MFSGMLQRTDPGVPAERASSYDLLQLLPQAYEKPFTTHRVNIGLEIGCSFMCTTDHDISI